jgi:hypothetical protein
MVYDRLHVERIRRLTALGEDTQELVWKKFLKVRRMRRLIIESYHLESTATTAVPYSDRACPGREAQRQFLGATCKWEGTILQKEDEADKEG